MEAIDSYRRLSFKTATHPRTAIGPVEGNTSEETKWLYERGDADAFMGIDTANISGMMMSTQDSFRKQLADLRRNLNQVGFCTFMLNLVCKVPAGRSPWLFST